MQSAQPADLFWVQDAFGDLRAELRVGFDAFVLVVGERCGLGEDGVGHADFPDVVQQRGFAQAAAPFGRPAQEQGEVGDAG